MVKEMCLWRFVLCVLSIACIFTFSDFCLPEGGLCSCPFPPVPSGVTPTVVDQTYPTEQANFYLWASGGKLYINIDPTTESFTIDVFEGYWGLSVTQDGVWVNGVGPN